MMPIMDVNLLHQHTELGDLPTVFSLIGSNNFKGSTVEFPDFDNNTILHVAAANNHCHIASKLLKYGANTEFKNFLGWTPLMQAARQGHCKMVKLLLKNNADMYTTNRLGMSVLMLACASGDIETVRAIFEAGGRVNEDVNSQINSLMVATLYGNNSIVKLLLDKGVNANVSSRETDITPLMFAAYGGTANTIEILLDRGAKPDLTNIGDYSAADISNIYKKNDISAKLENALCSPKKKKDKPLRDIMEATKQENFQAIQDILFHDQTKVETVTLEGATPLMIAAMLGNVPVAQLLVQYGANINAQDNANGWTPLMQAIYHRKTEMAKFLIKEGADVNISSVKGYTAFDLANETLDTEVLQLFAEIQNNCLNISETQKIPSSPTVLYMKQLWNKISSKPDANSRRNSYERRGSGSCAQTQYVAAKPEPIMPGIDSDQNEFAFTNVFEELNKMQKETMMLMEPPVITQPKRIVPRGSLKKLGNGFTYEHLMRKFDISRKTNMLNLMQEKKESLMEAEFVPKTSDIKITIEGPSLLTDNTNYLGKLSIPTTWYDPEASYSASSTLSGSLIRGLSENLGENHFRKLLEKLNMQQHLNALEEQEIDLDSFILLTRNDLREMGIEAPNKIRKVMNTIQKIKEIKNKI